MIVETIIDYDQLSWPFERTLKPWTPEKISGMFIVSRPIRSEMKPQKITAKPRHALVTTWFETSWLFFPNELGFLPRLTFKNQTTEFRIDLEASVNCQNLQRYKFSDEGFSATERYGSKITNHSQLPWVVIEGQNYFPLSLLAIAKSIFPIYIHD